MLFKELFDVRRDNVLYDIFVEIGRVGVWAFNTEVTV